MQRVWLTGIGLIVLMLVVAGCAGQVATPEPAPPADSAGSIPTEANAAPVEPVDQGEPGSAAGPTVEVVANPPTETGEAPPAEGDIAPTAAAIDLAALNIALEPVAEGLSAPIGLAHAGDGSGRLFIVEKGGVIRVWQDGQVLPAPFLAISERVGAQGSEQGLLGLAFHPAYAESGFFFVNYTDRGGNTVVSRFSVTDDPNQADPNSEEIVLTQTQPAGNHNGGHLAFGPDGYLYIGLGDGGGGGDTFGNGQNPQTWLGTLLRIDVDQLPYGVPPDNPFAGSPEGADEVWAYGLRNPWRFTFDRATNDLYIADVGQNQYEEVHFQPADSSGGENYGWPIMEGLHCFPETANCSPEGLAMPIAEYSHAFGCSITGGYVYRGEAFPAMNGVYFYGDYCSGIMWGLAPGADGGWQSMQLGETGARIASFGEDEAGEVYLVDMGGTVYRLVTR